MSDPHRVAGILTELRLRAEGLAQHCGELAQVVLLQDGPVYRVEMTRIDERIGRMRIAVRELLGEEDDSDA